MGKKKSHKAELQKPHAPAKKKGAGATAWILAAVAIIAVIAVIVLIGSRGSGAPAGAADTASGAVPAAEAKYIGRLLPAAYAAPIVAQPATYSATTKMTDVAAVQEATHTTVPVADVVADKIVYFEYAKAGAEPISMIAYVKPSGKLLVGVSYCIPCQGRRHSIDADGTLRCDSCGTKRDLETGVGISGACKLYPLDEVPVSVADGKIVIDNAVLDGWTAQPLDRPSGA